MGEAQFAAFGVFMSVVIVAALALGMAACAVDALRQWMRTRNEMAEHFEYLKKANLELAIANRDLQRRVANLEGAEDGD